MGALTDAIRLSIEEEPMIFKDKAKAHRDLFLERFKYLIMKLNDRLAACADEMIVVFSGELWLVAHLLKM